MEDRLAVLAHELRSPVAALAALADAFTAAEGPPAPEQARRLLELAADACRSIDRLLTDADLLSVEPVPVEVAPLVEGVTRGRAAVDVEPGLVVRGDPVRLRQALENLVGNAVRHGSAVRVTARAAGGEVAIAVSDDGPGVPEGIDVFAVGVSGAGSTGYGLAIARAIAERHGGRVELEPAAGDGATFTLVLPSVAG